MKPKTYIIDIDGTLIKHQGKGIRFQLYPSDGTVLEAAARVLNTLEQQGHHIVLMTARPEAFRDLTVQQLRGAYFVYHQLIMGVTSGERIIVNDTKPDDSPSCSAVVVKRNDGISCLLSE